MRKAILSILFTLSIIVTDAQTTAIPDSNFEQALIDLGHDNVIDGQVLTANIDTIQYLNIYYQSISDLTGIENFTALSELQCQNNQLTSLDVTQNTALTLLVCNNNQLTSLDVTQNSALTWLDCGSNQLTSMDVTQNIALRSFYCGFNQLTSLNVTQNTDLLILDYRFNQLTSIDVTQNTAMSAHHCSGNQLTSLDLTQNTALNILVCDNNQLTCLNIKNGNNSNFGQFGQFWSTNNPNLTCIEVDDVAWSTTNWTNIDAQSSFSISCPSSCIVGTKEISLSNFSLYPNPTTGFINLDLGEMKQDIKTTLTNSLGQTILTRQFESTDVINIDIDAPKGIYFLQLEVDGEVITKKIIKE